MLQIAFGGYQVITSGVAADSFTNHGSNVFLEPGFNIMVPADLSSPEADLIYVLIRKRDNATGDTFTGIIAADYTATVKDATTREDLDFSFVLNAGGDLINSGWNNALWTPLALSIEPFADDDSARQVRLIDIVVEEGGTNELISARLTVTSDSQPFAYLIVENRSSHLRPSTPNFGSTGIMTLTGKGKYAVMSSLATFEESTQALSDFSYPPDQVFYRVQDTLNKEDFVFSIDSASHDAILDNIDIMSVPQFPKAGVLSVDGFLIKALEGSTGLAYVDIVATGKTSGQEDTFRMYFSRTDGICVL